ncbi:MAG: cation-transporting P-type ATPase [Oligoflexia bacterium]|nr:cation-transporting P-type ATPase [Oligoflexia bacterium]
MGDRIQTLSGPEALQALQTRSTGLTEAEATERLRHFGPNEISGVKRYSRSRRFFAQFFHFLALVLWVAALLAFLADAASPGQGMALLGAAIIGVILVNGLFSFWQEYRAERMIEELRGMLPDRVAVLRAGTLLSLPSRALVPGDLLLLGEGDRVPADCRIVEARAPRVDVSALTGESLAEFKSAERDSGLSLERAMNILLAGSVVLSGHCRAVVFATGMRTRFGGIAALTGSVHARMAPLQAEIRRLSRFLAGMACILGAAFFLMGWALGLPLMESALFGVGIIVANVPEGLLPTVSVALAMGARRMMQRQAWVRHLPAVQTLGSATVICTDKTGTLTQNRMRVRRIYLPRTPGFLEPGELPSNSPIREIAAHCESTRQGRGDPMEQALLRFAASGTLGERIEEIPFDTDRKRLTTVYLRKAGATLYVKGALSAVLPLCRLSPENGVREKHALLEAEAALARDGMRVLAFALRKFPAEYTGGYLERDLTFEGLVALEDPIRPGVPAAVAKCREAGIRVIMLTGDHPGTALAVARQCGLAGENGVRIITGDALVAMTGAELKLALGAEPILFARVASEQKLRIVEALQERGEIVAVTGDGVNDAPALRRADIGVAMGRSGTDVAREASDMILLDDRFETIVSAIEEGRSVFLNIRKFLSYILASNVPELVPYLAFAFFRLPLALSVIQILAIDLGTDIVPALGLGAEPPEPHVMRQPPARFRGSLLDRGVFLRSYLFLGLLEALGAMTVFLLFLADSGWSWGTALPRESDTYRAATGACFGTIVIMQIANVFVCRSERETLPPWRFRPTGLILAGIALELLAVVLVVYSPAGNAVFGTAAVPARYWSYAGAFALLLVALDAALKRFRSGGMIRASHDLHVENDPRNAASRPMFGNEVHLQRRAEMPRQGHHRRRLPESRL